MTLRQCCIVSALAILSQGALAEDKGPTAGADTGKPKPAAAVPHPEAQAPPREIQLLFVRTALIALDQANKTNNYAVLRALGAPSLQVKTSDEMSAAFAGLRTLGLDLAPVTVVEPIFAPAPAISPDGVLRLAGVFPTRPVGIRFEVTMQPVGGFWRLAGLSAGSAGQTPAKVAGTRPAAKPAGKAAQPAAIHRYDADGTPSATVMWRSN